ncbi:MAG: hypothetical protein K8W52_39610 [Deltaproteobacteria bacterium]|nr:hypothetical protein [Deltaproteobacteria bacterium]
MRRSFLAAVVVVATALVGCKQGEGDRCESTADCASGLICTTSKPGVCVTSVVQFDAFMPDANVDGGPPAPDAAPDATPAPDAAPDAMPDAN